MIKRRMNQYASAADKMLRTHVFADALRWISEHKIYRISIDAANAVLRTISPRLERLRVATRYGRKIPLRLHIGCGNVRLDGYVNIDMRMTDATDVICDIIALPYPEHSVAIIETYHVIEHLPRHDLPIALRGWHRVLMPGGVLIIECPDFDGAAREYLQGNETRLDNIFGLQRFPGDTHRFGYNYDRLRALLADAGFINIRQSVPRDYHTQQEPCLRMECEKR